MPTCPACQAPLEATGDTGRCACGQHVRFIEVPERPCSRCGASLALDDDAVRCGACGLLQSADPARGVRVEANCPRCKRRLEVPQEATQQTCPHCAAEFFLQDTF